VRFWTWKHCGHTGSLALFFSSKCRSLRQRVHPQNDNEPGYVELSVSDLERSRSSTDMPSISSMSGGDRMTRRCFTATKRIRAWLFGFDPAGKC
jgi:hypothetical protein